MNPYVGIVQIRCAGLSGCLLSAERLPVFVHFMIGRNRRLCHSRSRSPYQAYWCQGRNVKSSPLCGTGTLHGCGFRLYTRCVKQRREPVSAKILNVTGGRDEPFQTYRVPPAAARAFSHLLLYFGCNRASGMIQLRCRVTAAFTQGRLQILHGGKEYSCAALRRAYVGDYINRRKK